jgi:hypothetical protein
MSRQTRVTEPMASVIKRARLEGYKYPDIAAYFQRS